MVAQLVMLGELQGLKWPPPDRAKPTLLLTRVNGKCESKHHGNEAVRNASSHLVRARRDE